MDWIPDVLLGLAAPAAGVLGAWFGGRGVVQQARISSEHERNAERDRYEREVRQRLEQDLQQRVESLVLAVAAVRNLPPEDRRRTEAEHQEGVRREEAIYPAYAALVTRCPALAPEAMEVCKEAVSGVVEGGHELFGGERFAEAVAELNRKLILEVEGTTSAV